MVMLKYTRFVLKLSAWKWVEVEELMIYKLRKIYDLQVVFHGYALECVLV